MCHHTGMDITLSTPLTEIAAHYDGRIYDNLDAIGEELIDSRVVGQDWGMALDRVLRQHGDAATVGDLRDELLADA